MIVIAAVIITLLMVRKYRQHQQGEKGKRPYMSPSLATAVPEQQQPVTPPQQFSPVPQQFSPAPPPVQTPEAPWSAESPDAPTVADMPTPVPLNQSGSLPAFRSFPTPREPMSGGFSTISMPEELSPMPAMENQDFATQFDADATLAGSYAPVPSNSPGGNGIPGVNYIQANSLDLPPDLQSSLEQQPTVKKGQISFTGLQDDPVLEEMMQQVQMGLYVMPKKEEQDNGNASSNNRVP